jgi:hypothetical protein
MKKTDQQMESTTSGIEIQGGKEDVPIAEGRA